VIALQLSFPGRQQIPQRHAQRFGDSICRGHSDVSIAALNSGDIWLGQIGKFGEFSLRHPVSLTVLPDNRSKEPGNVPVATLLLGWWPSHDAIVAPRIVRT
jgi:hypothetical protein